MPTVSDEKVTLRENTGNTNIPCFNNEMSLSINRASTELEPMAQNKNHDENRCPTHNPYAEIYGRQNNSSNKIDSHSRDEDVDNEESLRSRNHDEVTSFQTAPIRPLQTTLTQGADQEVQQSSSGGGGGSDGDGNLCGNTQDTDKIDNDNDEDDFQNEYDEGEESKRTSSIYCQRVLNALKEYPPDSMVPQSFYISLNSFGKGEFDIKTMARIAKKIHFHPKHRDLFSGRTFRRYFLMPYVRRNATDSVMTSQEYPSP